MSASMSPSVPPIMRRTVQIILKVTPKEKELLVRAAALSKQKRARWMRDVLLAAASESLPPAVCDRSS